MPEKAIAPRRRRDKEVRQGEILDAAFDVFARDGFAAARVDEIAERAGVSKGTVYLYFATKEALFEGVVRSHIGAALDQIAVQSSREHLSHEARLRATLRASYTLLAGSKIRNIVIMLIGEGGRFPQLVEFYFNNVIVRSRSIIAKVVNDGVADGVFRPISVEAFPQLIIGPGVMGAIWAQHFQRLSPIDLDDLYEAHMDLLLNGLLKK